MTVAELMNVLAKCPLHAKIIISKDPEGNAYHELQAFEQMFCKEDGYEYEVGYDKLTPELEKRHYGKEDLIEDGEPCMVLWP